MKQELTPEMVMDIAEEMHQWFLNGLQLDDVIRRFGADEVIRPVHAGRGYA